MASLLRAIATWMGRCGGGQGRARHQATLGCAEGL